MANYLVTGAAGFIGARVTEMLLEDGHFVAGIDDLNDAYDVRLKHWRLKHLTDHPNFNFHHVDISDHNALECADLTHSGQTKSYDAIINLAARAGVRQALEDPWLYLNTNVTGTLNLLELSRLYEIPKFILASTSSVYGSDAPLPTPEEADSSKPLQPYAASKIGAEALTFTYHYLYGIDVTVFRYFTVYGPASRPDMSMFRFTQWISEGRESKVVRRRRTVTRIHLHRRYRPRHNPGSQTTGPRNHKPGRSRDSKNKRVDSHLRRTHWSNGNCRRTTRPSC